MKQFRHNLLLLFFALGICSTVQAQCTFTSNASGVWSTNIWTCSGCGATPCTGPPPASANIVILNGHTVSLQADITHSGTITVNAGGTLQNCTGGGGCGSGAYGITMNGSTLTVNGTLDVDDLTLSAGTTTTVGAAGTLWTDKFLANNGSMTVNGTLNVGTAFDTGAGSTTTTNGTSTIGGAVTNNGMYNAYGTTTIGGNFNNTSTGQLHVYGDMSVAGGFANSPSLIHIYATGNLTIDGNVDNNGGILINDGYIYVGGNLRNNPGGTLTGSGGTWDVDINAINTAGGFIEGDLDFCDYDMFNACLVSNSCVTMACTLDCADAANPLNSASGTIDSTDVKSCGISLLYVLSADNPILLQGTLGAAGAELIWRTNYEANADVYKVLRSTNGVSYEQVAAVSAIGNMSQPVEYRLTDTGLPLGSTVYYRVIRSLLDGNQEHSNVVTMAPDMTPSILLYPNPARGQVQVSLTGLAPGAVSLKVYNIMGGEVMNLGIEVPEGQSSISVPLSFNLASGHYYVRATATNGFAVDKLIVNY